MSNVLPRLSARDLNLSNTTSYTPARVPAVRGPEEAQGGIKGTAKNEISGYKKGKEDERDSRSGREERKGWKNNSDKGKKNSGHDDWKTAKASRAVPFAFAWSFTPSVRTSCDASTRF